MVPLPATPAARIVMSALPLTGCVVCKPFEVDSIDGERDGAGWGETVVAWCVGPTTASRAREHGWPKVQQLAEDTDENELIEAIAGRMRSE